MLVIQYLSHSFICMSFIRYPLKVCVGCSFDTLVPNLDTSTGVRFVHVARGFVSDCLSP